MKRSSHKIKPRLEKNRTLFMQHVFYVNFENLSLDCMKNNAMQTILTKQPTMTLRYLINIHRARFISTTKRLLFMQSVERRINLVQF